MEKRVLERTALAALLVTTLVLSGCSSQSSGKAGSEKKKEEVVSPAYSSQAAHVKILNSNRYGSGCFIGRDGDDWYVLTAYHCVREGATSIDWFCDQTKTYRHTSNVTVVAYDQVYDLALLKVRGVNPHTVCPVCTPWERPKGKGTLYGFPGGTYFPGGLTGTMNEKGDLSFQVRGGNSGGPFMEQLEPMNFSVLTGVLTRYHGCATIEQIRSFLHYQGYDWLYYDCIRIKPEK